MSQTVKEIVELPKNQYFVLEQIAFVNDTTVGEYLKEIIIDVVESTLDNHIEIGLTFCSKLKQQFSNKEEVGQE